MKKSLFFSITFLMAISLFAQLNKQNMPAKQPTKPKLVVGIMVDQMRWDYLYRFNDLYKPNGGFKRLLNDGLVATIRLCLIYQRLQPAAIPAFIPAVFLLFMVLRAITGTIITC